jgi:SAM-dependent methyltransferase
MNKKIGAGSKVNRGQVQYWNKRASDSYLYEGELFYTITPIPLYIRRRHELLKILHAYIANNKNSLKSILDFGCGDGWYLDYFAKNFPNIVFYGTDISQDMVDISNKKSLVNSNFSVKKMMEGGLDYAVRFDLIYSITVFAHIVDQGQCENIFQDIHRQLDENGIFVLFEQTGPIEKKWATGVKRTVDQYVKIAAQVGFEKYQVQHMTFPIHRHFETKVARYIYKYYAFLNRICRNTDTAPIRANKSKIFRSISNLLVNLTRDPYKYSPLEAEGYTFICFKKTVEPNSKETWH